MRKLIVIGDYLYVVDDEAEIKVIATNDHSLGLPIISKITEWTYDPNNPTEVEVEYAPCTAEGCNGDGTIARSMWEETCYECEGSGLDKSKVIVKPIEPEPKNYSLDDLQGAYKAGYKKATEKLYTEDELQATLRYGDDESRSNNLVV